ncbi:ATP-binding cassette domain-containing protein [Marinicrinis lubricantis]|uniref:ATP-binding cassette domain-containing protein n=1 Tax=Marinicrinis lubricantis TaxID=2086470 RepID=A0ABW1IK84_9BACL
MIRILDVSKQYDRETLVLQQIELHMKTGVMGLLGFNGAGKSTLLKIMAGIEEPTAGDVMICGYSVRSEPDEVRSRIGYLPQHFEMYPHLTGREMLDYACTLKGIRSRKKRKEIVTRLLYELNLEAKAKDKIKTYSTGMKQRLGLAQAMIGEPPVLIIDEPTVGLDPEEKMRVRKLLAAYGREHTVVLSTHILSDVENCCTHAAVLDEGKIRWFGIPDCKSEYREILMEGHHRHA